MRMPENVRTFEAMGGHQRLIVQNVLCRAIGHDGSGIKHDDARTDFNNQFQVMGGDDPGVLEGLEQFDQPATRPRIQI